MNASMKTIVSDQVCPPGTLPTSVFFELVQRGALEEVQKAVRNGQDVRARNHNASTPLIMAAAFGHRQVCDVLVAAGADLEAADRGKSTPLQAAAYNGHHDVCAALAAAGAKVNAADDNGLAPLHISNFQRTPHCV